jgi:single-strand DNA-binding protein
MSNTIEVQGNIGNTPTQKQISGKTVTEFSVFADEYKYDETTKKYTPNGGEWYNVTVWAPVLATATFETLQKGARVVVTGKLSANVYHDKKLDKHLVSLNINADDVTHKLNRVETVSLRKPAERQEPADA